jgi:hypothetical protein
MTTFRQRKNFSQRLNFSPNIGLKRATPPTVQPCDELPPAAAGSWAAIQPAADNNPMATNASQATYKRLFSRLRGLGPVFSLSVRLMVTPCGNAVCTAARHFANNEAHYFATLRGHLSRGQKARLRRDVDFLPIWTTGVRSGNNCHVVTSGRKTHLTRNSGIESGGRHSTWISNSTTPLGA